MKRLLLFSFISYILLISYNSFGQFQKVFTDNNNIYALASNNEFVFAGTGGSGLFRSSDNGNTWNGICNGIPAWYYFSMLSLNDSLFAGSFGYVYFSADNGTTWEDLNIGLQLNDYVYALARKGQYIYAGIRNKGVYSHQIGTASWNVCNVGLHNQPTIMDLLIIGSDIYVATDKGIYKSTNDAASWDLLNNGLSNTLEVNKLLFVDANTSIYAGTADNIYKSSDFGNSWTLSGGVVLDGYNVSSIGFFNDTIFSGTYSGLYASADFGNNWFQFNDGLPSGASVYSMTASANSLFAGTGGSIYRYPSIPVKIDSITRDILTIYTYPANLSEYLVLVTTEELKGATVFIYNIQGQQIIKEPLTQKKSIIDISFFEKGVYIVRLSTPGNDYTKKFIKK